MRLLDQAGRVCTIVDGGVVSAFPVWLFDAKNRPATRPTFGLRLVAPRAPERRFLRGVGWPFAMARDIFSTGSEARDDHFAADSTAVRTCLIRTSGDIAGTRFNASTAEREDLLASGRRSMREFLESFELANYRNSAGQPYAPDAVTDGRGDPPRT